MTSAHASTNETAELFLIVAPGVASRYGYDDKTVNSLIQFMMLMMPVTFKKWWNKLPERKRTWITNKLIEGLKPADSFTSESIPAENA